MVFHGDPADKEFGWKWGGVEVPVVTSYTYLGVVFSEDCRWDTHATTLISKGLRAVASYSRLFRAERLSVAAKRTLLLMAIRPVLEYASGVWLPSCKDSEKLETVQLKAARSILQCAVTTPSLALRGDLRLELLSVRREVSVVGWRRRVEMMGEDRYPRRVWEASWPKLRRGGEVKSWRREVTRVMQRARIREEMLEDSSIEDLRKLVCDSYVDGEMVGGRKLEAYRKLGDEACLQPYLQGCLNLGARLKFKFRSGSHGLGEELGRRGGVARDERHCSLCSGSIETVAHFLLDCPAVGDFRVSFLASLQTLLGGNNFHAFRTLPSETQALRLLAHSPWGDKAGEVDCLVQDYLVKAWKLRSNVLYKEKSHYYQEGLSTSSSLSSLSLAPSGGAGAGSMVPVAMTREQT